MRVNTVRIRKDVGQIASSEVWNRPWRTILLIYIPYLSPTWTSLRQRSMTARLNPKPRIHCPRWRPLVGLVRFVTQCTQKRSLPRRIRIADAASVISPLRPERLGLNTTKDVWGTYQERIQKNLEFLPIFLPDHYRQDEDRIGFKPASVLAGEVLTATCEGHTTAQYQLFRILPRYVWIVLEAHTMPVN